MAGDSGISDHGSKARFQAPAMAGRKQLRTENEIWNSTMAIIHSVPDGARSGESAAIGSGGIPRRLEQYIGGLVAIAGKPMACAHQCTPDSTRCLRLQSLSEQLRRLSLYSELLYYQSLR